MLWLCNDPKLSCESGRKTVLPTLRRSLHVDRAECKIFGSAYRFFGSTPHRFESIRRLFFTYNFFLNNISPTKDVKTTDRMRDSCIVQISLLIL